MKLFDVFKKKKINDNEKEKLMLTVQGRYLLRLRKLYLRCNHEEKI